MGCIRLLTTAFCIALLVPAGAQVEGTRSFGNPRVIGAAEGLLSTNVRDAVMDDDGFLWIATSNGLHRYDGSHMRVLLHDPADSTSMPADDLTFLLLASDGTLWVGTGSGGLARVDRSSLTCMRYQHRPEDPRSISAPHVSWAMEDRAGTLFFGVRNAAICRFNAEQGNFDRIAFPEYGNTYESRARTNSYCMVQDRYNDDVYWCATTNGILRLKGPEWSMHHFIMPEENTANKLHLRTNSFRELTQAPDGSLLAATWGAGIVHMDSTGKHFRRYAILQDGAIRQFTNTFNALTVDTDGNIWVGNNTTGLALLDTTSGTINMLVPGEAPELAGLDGQGVNRLRTTVQGDLLVITRQDVRLFSNMRQRFRSLRFVSQVRPYVGMHVIQCLLPLDDGSVLLSGYGLDGIYRFRPSNASLLRIAPPERVWDDPSREHFSVDRMVRGGQNEVLAIGAYKLYRINLSTQQMTYAESNFNDSSWNSMFQGVFRHSSGELYLLGRHDGLIRLRNDLSVAAQYLPDRGDPHALANGSNLLSAVEDRSGRLWIGHDRGYSILDPESGHFINLDPATRSDSIARLERVGSMAIDPQGRIWMTDAKRGVVVVDDPLEHPFRTRTLTSHDSLPFERVGELFFDTDGSLWLSGIGGLAQRTASGWQVSGTAVGLPGGSLGGPVVRSSEDVLVGAAGRMLFWEPERAREREGAPRLYLASIRVFDDEIDLEAVGSSNALRFRYDQNFLKLTFSLVDVLGQYPHRIEYRLTPTTKEWLATDANGVASFANVPDGDHLLEFRAVGDDDTILATQSVPLTVIAPWWRTWWFRSAAVLGILLLAYGLFRMRINAVRKEARLTSEFDKRLADMELTALRAQMNPHFLFNSLNSIRHHVLNSRIEEADRHLSKFARLIRLILDHSDQRTVPLAEELQALRLYMELEASRFDDKFSHHIFVDPSIDQEATMVPPMLIQPYLENAIWHGLMQKSEGGELALRIHREGRTLRIEVEDDGIGRTRAAELKSRSALKKRSMGMSITEQRLAMIQKQQGIRCDVRVEDLILADGTAGGTRITLTLPLN